MLTQQNPIQNENIPHFRYQISSDTQIVILNQIIASEQSIELYDFIFHLGNVINEFTNFTIYQSTNQNNYYFDIQGYFCQSNEMNLMSLKEYEEKQQKNGFYIKFKAQNDCTSDQLQKQLVIAEKIIKKLRQLAYMKISENIYDDLKKWIKANIQ